MPDPKVDTAAYLEAAKKNLADAQAKHDAAVEEAVANKPLAEIFTDLLEAIVMRLGNRPDMRAMVVALKKQTEPAPAEAPPTDQPKAA